MPSLKIEKVPLKTETKNKQQWCHNGACNTASCPELSKRDEESVTKRLEARSLISLRNKTKNVAMRILAHLFIPDVPLPPSNAKSPVDDTASNTLNDIFTAFACPHCPPGGLPCDIPGQCSKLEDGSYRVTFDTPQPCNGSIWPDNHSGMGLPNQNCYSTCPSCGGYCQTGGQCGCSSYRGWGPCGPCGICCCCAAPNCNMIPQQTFYAPCTPEAIRSQSQTCFGSVLYASAAPVDCCTCGSASDNSACPYCGYHQGWDSCQMGNYQPSCYQSSCYQPSSYQPASYQPSNNYGQCQCCFCAAQLAAAPNFTEPASMYHNTCDANAPDSNYYGWSTYNNSQYQCDPSWSNNRYDYKNHNPWTANQYAMYQDYNYAPNAATYAEPSVCNAEPEESPEEAASSESDPKQPPEPPKCVKNISSPASDSATATVCFCPEPTKKLNSYGESTDIGNKSDSAAQKPLPPPRWHGINPTLAKSYPFNSTTRKYHQRTSPVDLARASFSLTTPQSIKATGTESETKENSDEVEMPQVWSFPESYKRFFNSLSTRSDGDKKKNEKTPY